MRFHNIALFVGGTLFGSAGFKILASKDAKKVLGIFSDGSNSGHNGVGSTKV